MREVVPIKNEIDEWWGLKDGPCDKIMVIDALTRRSSVMVTLFTFCAGADLYIMDDPCSIQGWGNQNILRSFCKEM